MLNFLRNTVDLMRLALAELHMALVPNPIVEDTVTSPVLPTLADTQPIPTPQASTMDTDFLDRM